MKNHKRIAAGVVMLAAGLLLLTIARLVHGFGQWYSVNIYAVLVNTIGRVMGIFPFSVSETGIYVLIVCLILMIVKCMQKKCFYDLLVNIFLIGTILFFLYCTNCGVNYYRLSFAESTGLNVNEYTVSDLKDTCIWLTEKVNETGGQVNRDGNGVMYLSADEAKEAVRVMGSLGGSYPELSGYYPRPKGLFNHWILSVQKLSGIYSPFTIEANYNTGMTDYNIPFTACHELSHLRGFMQEEEANFIAFLACLESETNDFKYSGYMLGWIHCMNLLYRIDYEAWEEIRLTLSEKVEPDLKANSAFWDKYDGTVAEVADRINDTYLKANGQEDGVASYGRMADLIVIYYCKNIDQITD